MELGEYIGYHTWKEWTGDAFGTFNSTEAAYFVLEMRKSGIVNINAKRVVELGFGNGVFAGWAKQQGAIYVGTELIPELIARGTAAGFDVQSAACPLTSFTTNNSIDLVVAMDVFEHIDTSALQNLLIEAGSCLRPGGLVVARVPSGDSPFARSIQHGDLTHRIILGSSAIRQLASQSGFVVKAIREPAFPIRGLGARVFIRRLAIVCARRIIYPLITQVLMGGGRPVLTPNLVCVLEKR